MKIHLVFYSNLLQLDPENLLPGQIKALLLLVIIDNEEEFELKKILDSRLHSRSRKLQYKVAWVGYPPDLTWYNAENVANSPELVTVFYAGYPGKPGP